MREPLTRAQVEELAQRAAAWTDGVEIAAWLETDAALRAEVARVTEQVKALEGGALHDVLVAQEQTIATLHEEVTKLEMMLYPGGT